MNVLKAKSAGFCMGVALALHRLDKALIEFQTGTHNRLATLGPIIHNPRVMTEYAAKGVLCFHDASLVNSGDKVLIRAHGIPRETEAELAKKGAELLDATCPKVKEAQLAIAEEARRGSGTLLLFGEADHPEVQGLVSYADGDALVFGSEEELAALELRPEHDYYLAAQTTQNTQAFARINEILTKRLGRKLTLLETICDATRKRQDEAIQLAKQVDIMVVVGGSNSGNTRRLAEVATAQGVPAMLVECVEDIDSTMLEGKYTVGLTAGASTPKAHIDAVYGFLKTFNACKP